MKPPNLLSIDRLGEITGRPANPQPKQRTQWFIGPNDVLQILRKTHQ